MHRGSWHDPFARRGFGMGGPRGRGPGPAGRGFGGQGPPAKEIASRSIFIQSKKFYVDVRENHRGKFIKISEVAVNGQKTRVMFDMLTAKEFSTKLNEFCDYFSTLGPAKRDSARMMEDEGKLKSESIFREDRRYYIDLKENHRGRFLKVSMALSAHERSHIVIPAQGMMDMRDVLNELLAEHGDVHSPSRTRDPDPSSGTQGPDPSSGTQDPDTAPSIDTAPDIDNDNFIEYDGKKYIFDISENSRGKYLRISEVSPSFRTAVTVPQESFKQFIEMVEKAMAKTNKEAETERMDATSNEPLDV